MLAKPTAFLRKTHLWLVLITIIFLLGVASPVLADNLDYWYLCEPLPQGDILLNSVTYCNNNFVATGNSSSILTSPDGITWPNQTSGGTDWPHGVAYGNKTFVAAGWYSTYTSHDGILWLQRPLDNSTYGLNGITTHNDTFVAVGTQGRILISPDGITWTRCTSGTTNTL